MKKIMIALGAVVCAAVVNAASFSWACTGDMTDSNGNTLTSMSPAGAIALVYLGSGTADWENAKVVQTATPQFSSSMGKTAAKVSANFNFSIDDYSNGDIFGVVFQSSADNQLYYLQQGGANYKPTYTISGLADDTSSLSGFTFASSSFFGTTAPSAAVVPEPTSALLLVLGMAGLALRRKRA